MIGPAGAPCWSRTGRRSLLRRRRITTHLFEETAGTAAIGRAEALRRSMLALMETPDKPYYAHPLFWAPFVVVGEGARP